LSSDPKPHKLSTETQIPAHKSKKFKVIEKNDLSWVLRTCVKTNSLFVVFFISCLKLDQVWPLGVRDALQIEILRAKGPGMEMTGAKFPFSLSSVHKGTHEQE
jgi:hypothetical protein